MPAQSDLIPFQPHPLVRGGNLQTALGYYLPGPKELRPTKVHQVRLADGDTLALCENLPMSKSSVQPVIVFMHGLGGHSGSVYMIRLAKVFKDRGWIAFRMNHRGCGEGTGLARQIYHSGRSEDISAVLKGIADRYPDRPIIAVGFSLSGNALLKLLGEGKHPIPKNLCGSIAITPPILLSKCANELSQLRKSIYSLRFIRLLKRSLQERRQQFGDFPEFDVPWNTSIRQFDEICTARLNGFDSAEDYYSKCSAKQFIADISDPVFVLASSDDPFIPKTTFDDFPENPAVELLMTDGGGHMGFVSRHETPLGDRHWLDYAILSKAESFLRAANREATQNTE